MLRRNKIITATNYNKNITFCYENCPFQSKVVSVSSKTISKFDRNGGYECRRARYCRLLFKDLPKDRLLDQDWDLDRDNFDDDEAFEESSDGCCWDSFLKDCCLSHRLLTRMTLDVVRLGLVGDFLAFVDKGRSEGSSLTGSVNTSWRVLPMILMVSMMQTMQNLYTVPMTVFSILDSFCTDTVLVLWAWLWWFCWTSMIFNDLIMRNVGLILTMLIAHHCNFKYNGILSSLRRWYCHRAGECEKQGELDRLEYVGATYQSHRWLCFITVVFNSS